MWRTAAQAEEEEEGVEEDEDKEGVDKEEDEEDGDEDEDEEAEEEEAVLLAVVAAVGTREAAGAVVAALRGAGGGISTAEVTEAAGAAKAGSWSSDRRRFLADIGAGRQSFSSPRMGVHGRIACSGGEKAYTAPLGKERKRDGHRRGGRRRGSGAGGD